MIFHSLWFWILAINIIWRPAIFYDFCLKGSVNLLAIHRVCVNNDLKQKCLSDKYLAQWFVSCTSFLHTTQVGSLYNQITTAGYCIYVRFFFMLNCFITSMKRPWYSWKLLKCWYKYVGSGVSRLTQKSQNSYEGIKFV